MLNNIHEAPLHKVKLFLDDPLCFQEGGIMNIFIPSPDLCQTDCLITNKNIFH